MNTFTEVAEMSACKIKLERAVQFFFLFFSLNMNLLLLLSLDFHTRANRAAGVPDRLHVNTTYVRGQPSGRSRDSESD